MSATEAGTPFSPTPLTPGIVVPSPMAELRFRCLELAVKMDAGDPVTAAVGFYQFVLCGPTSLKEVGDA